MLPSNELQPNRRTFLNKSGLSVGTAALTVLLAQENLQADSPSDNAGLPGFPQLPPRVKRVIFLCMAGGPSHLETFDYKPELAALDGQPMPESYTAGQPIAQLQGQALKCLGPLTKFRPSGQSGTLISDFLPWHQKMADEICVLKSMVTEQINHLV